MTGLAEAFPAGELLGEELDARGWTQVDFAEILGRPSQFVSEILSGKKEITRESAAQIGAALGTSAQLWLNLQDAYHLWRQGRDEKVSGELEDVRLRARLAELAPIAVLRKRGYLRGDGPRAQADELMALYGMRDIQGEPDFVLAARRSNEDDELTSTQTAWVACVRSEARSAAVARFSQDELIVLAARLPGVLRDPERFERLPELLASAGVRLVFVEAFPSSKIDGCALLVDDIPTIGLSGRGHRLDKVLFTLMHEIAHIALGHLDEEAVILDEDAAENGGGREEAANARAARWLLPHPLPQPPDRVDAGWVNRIADEIGVHPIVIVGRLQNDRLLSWRTSLVSGAPNVLAYMRGWPRRPVPETG